jgi:ceramide glucosyltransferase
MDVYTLAAITPVGVSAATFLTLRAACAWRLARERNRARTCAATPRVSILKPMTGNDDDLAANLASFAELDYPDYELLLGVPSAVDSAYAAARRFVEAFPHVEARIVLTGSVQALNPKVAQLIALEKCAHGAIVVISDSNVRAPRTYLQSLVAALYEPHVGLVSSVVVGTGETSLGAAVENLQLTGHVAPTIVGISAFGRAISVGKSMAMWRSRLALVGGFERVAGVLAEDHILGTEFERHGFFVRVCTDRIENRNVGCSVGRTFERHTRWAKLRRAIDPTAFALEPLLSPALVATCALLARPCALTGAILAFSLMVQMLAAVLTMRVLRGGPIRLRWAWIEIARTYAAGACWLSACATRRVQWRGHAFLLRPGSAIVLAGPGKLTTLRTLFASFRSNGVRGALGRAGLGRRLAT